MVDFSFAHRPEGYDNHIEKSIRGYTHLIQDVVSFSRYFIEDNTEVVDVGCSTGEFLSHIKWEGEKYGMEINQFAKKIASSLINFKKIFLPEKISLI